MKPSLNRLLLFFSLFALLTACTKEISSNPCTDYIKKNEFDKAIEQCTKEIEKGGESSEQAMRYALRGNAYSQKDEYEKAISDFDTAIELSPKYAYAFYQRGVAHISTGQYEESIADFSRAIGLKPDAWAYAMRGNAYGFKGEYDRAIADHNKAIEIDPDFEWAYLVRAYAYLLKGDPDTAIRDIDKALELNPKFAVAYETRGYAYSAMDDHNKAIEDFNRAIAIDPSNSQAYLWLVIESGQISDAAYISAIKKLDQVVYNEKTEEYERTIIEFFMAKNGVDEAAVLREAQKGKRELDIRRHLCTTYYFLGEKRLREGNIEGAKEFFTKSVETNEHSFFEYASAKKKLELMKRRGAGLRSFGTLVNFL